MQEISARVRSLERSHRGNEELEIGSEQQNPAFEGDDPTRK